MVSTSKEVAGDAENIGKDCSCAPSWGMSQERAFMENLLGQRTSFLLVFFALVIGGAVTASRMPGTQLAILLLGTAVVFLLSLAVGRAQKKLDIIFDILKEDSTHPFTVIDEKAGPTGSKRWLVGYALPWLCAIALSAASVASWLGCLQ